MKNLVIISFLSLTAAVNVYADFGSYSCKEIKSNKTAYLSFVMENNVKRITWMPSKGLKTTKANSSNSSLTLTKDLEFVLFGFQDQADILVVPLNTGTTSKIVVKTYLDNDDVSENEQSFNCVAF